MLDTLMYANDFQFVMKTSSKLYFNQLTLMPIALHGCEDLTLYGYRSTK